MLTPPVRWMINRDMPAVYAIEDRSFEYPWTRDEFWRCLRTRDCMSLVAEHAQAVAGYVVYEIHDDRLRILNFAVHPDLRRQGVGRAMVQKLTGKLSPNRRRHITLEIREINLQAQLFFRALGFRAVRIKHGFYAETDEDAYVFEYRLPCSTRTSDEIVRCRKLP